uniref:DDRGK domain-containing protein 1 n=1 Tax=Latimeria chalumnae TaxID=7897 RepID=H2ZUF5_LATCH
MDPVVYLLVAVILAVLILFVSKVRGRAEQADREHQQNVAAAVARPRAQTEERGEGMPRRRRNMGSRLMAQRRAQQTEQEMAEVLEEEEEAPEIQTGKIGAKKQRKLEEKQARKAQREAEETEREERRKMEQKREEERRKDDERSRLEEERQSSKVVLLEDLGSHFGLRTQDAINRLQELIAEGTLTGVIDDRGKFIYITKEELAAVAQFIRQRGRVSIAELAQASNSLINLKPDINISPGTVV